jgi:hypothetical protein
VLLGGVIDSLVRELLAATLKQLTPREVRRRQPWVPLVLLVWQWSFSCRVYQHGLQHRCISMQQQSLCCMICLHTTSPIHRTQTH